MNLPTHPVKVLMISPVAPPIGGNSVHVRRLLNVLGEKGLHVVALDYQAGPYDDKGDNVLVMPRGMINRLQFLLALRRSLRPSTIVHFHVSAFGRFKWFAPILMLLFSAQRKIVTIHSGSFQKQVDLPIIRQYLALLVRQFDHVITVNESQREFLIELGVDPERIDVIPAYIRESIDPQSAPGFLQQIPIDRFVVVTSGYLTPIYDYETLIECITELHSDAFQFIFAFYNQFDAAYSARISAQLERHKNVTVVRNLTSQEFLHVLHRGLIYVRTAVTDGDCVAIREALDLGLEVFATDCVQRPEGCRLFPVGASHELCGLFSAWQSSQSTNVHRSPECEQISNVEQIYDIYQKLWRLTVNI